MRVTTRNVQEFKKKGQKFAVLTAYDYPTAKLVEEAGVPVILVGDSLGQVVLGYDSTVKVTMEEMLHHTKAVVRGTQRAMVVGDMPFLSYNLDEAQALSNAGRFLQEAGAQAVKLEGGVHVADTVKRITEAGIPVMGHIGLTPQSVHQLGGYRVQGKTSAEAHELVEDALALEAAGAFAVVLELIPASVAETISQRLTIPTIGIGAGVGCDAQVQVINDMLGLNTAFVPKHAKRYATLGDTMRDAIAAYAAEVQAGTFPTDKESFLTEDSILKDIPQA
ncbi:MAG: 3-methyl-2-oxobutanoate hydroxymethyltransferase [SAR202 cluster bacterium]|nr:3-methyl-2-oxobutanoate hydroxymethyltransferase [SAR202 cluster bacterium]